MVVPRTRVGGRRRLPVRGADADRPPAARARHHRLPRTAPAAGAATVPAAGAADDRRGPPGAGWPPRAALTPYGFEREFRPETVRGAGPPGPAPRLPRLVSRGR